MSNPIKQSFTLNSHPTTPTPWIHNITVNCCFNTDHITLRYQIIGDVKLLQIPKICQLRNRADNLWQHTCCEAFIAQANTSQYREWNFSPSGQWQLYEFAKYLELRIEPETLAPQIHCDATTEQFNLTAQIPNHLPHLHTQKLRLGLTVVLQDLTGKIYYWALKHSSALPDFHKMDTWMLIS